MGYCWPRNPRNHTKNKNIFSCFFVGFVAIIKGNVCDLKPFEFKMDSNVILTIEDNAGGSKSDNKNLFHCSGLFSLIYFMISG